MPGNLPNSVQELIEQAFVAKSRGDRQRLEEICSDLMTVAGRDSALEDLVFMLRNLQSCNMAIYQPVLNRISGEY